MVDYLVRVCIFASFFSIFALGLNLQWGFAGLINFGHVAFMTLGAYATVLLSSQGVPILIAVGVGALLAAGLGLLVGTSTLRLREDYLSIVTIGVSEVIRLVANNEEWLTRGSFGVQSYPLPLGAWEPGGFGKVILFLILAALGIFASTQLWQGLSRRRRAGKKGKVNDWVMTLIAQTLIGSVTINGFVAIANYQYKVGLMILALLSLALVFWGLEFITHSPWGRVLKAIREDEEIPRALGKSVFWYKLQAFMLGGVIAGIGGAFYAWQLTTVYPSSFDPLVTFNAWTMVVLGGAGSNPGAVLGAVIFWIYDSVTRFVLSDLPWLDAGRIGAFRLMAIGLILMVMMRWRPQGILGNKDELTLTK
ncbi:MAG: branched-chain amino acid ABC transporter permease [Cyanobacteria bacterium P01_H01_bin.15]